MSPRRIQRKRTKGWRMPEGAVYVGRPTKWGNPRRVGDSYSWISHDRTRLRRDPVSVYHQVALDAEMARNLYTNDVADRIVGVPTVDEIRAELAGRDLACWCPLDQPCHEDVLLEIANGGQP